VLRRPAGAAGHWARPVFAQFADGTQLDLAVVAQPVIEARHRAGGAPDFIALSRAPAPPGSAEPNAPAPAGGHAPDGQAPGGQAPGDEPPAAYAVTGEQIREWAFLGWCALIDADKYLRRGSLWEAHSRLHEARERS